MAGSYPEILDRLGLGPPVHMGVVTGGCISDSRKARFSDGTEVFVKCGGRQKSGMFQKEAAGLEELAAAKALRVPDVLLVDESSLVLELIQTGRQRPHFFQQFGQRFARMHRMQGGRCGFGHDNFIGSTVQLNGPVEGRATRDGEEQGEGRDWPEFFLQRRLRFQAELALKNGFGTELLTLLDQAERRIEGMLYEAVEPPSVLHGDLWGGNFIVDERGEACLIDPAVYYGHREADLAMTYLFGGFEPGFYGAYEEEFPLEPGHATRRSIYQLYHLLNHLNLFGRGYYDQCENILRKFTQ